MLAILPLRDRLYHVAFTERGDVTRVFSIRFADMPIMSRTTVKTRDGRVFIMPSDEEDAAIHAAALSDPDAQPWTDEQLAAALPTLRIGRPPHTTPLKAPVTLRLDVAVLAAFKATGKDWQTRINAALSDWLKTHSAAP
jgi:uncharacterized protein (DUF4415 family)